MKSSGRVRTLRGRITPSGGKADVQLILNDQLINRGLKVTGFFVWGNAARKDQDQQFTAILSYAQLPSATTDMDAGDNTQLGWAFQCSTARNDEVVPGQPTAIPFASSGYFNQLIDPDHIINRDLFISFRNSNDQPFNYLVVCELMDLTDDEAIITIIKENSQSIE